MKKTGAHPADSKNSVTQLEKGLKPLDKIVVTPEGVPLVFRLATGGERAGAFLLDFIIIFGTLLVLSFGLGLASILADWLATMLFFLAFFFLRFFYFIAFEIRWQGRSPGKRATGLRVVDRNGGPVTADAVIARNLMRDMEVVTPFLMLVFSPFIWPAAPGWLALLCVGWISVFGFMPLWNRERLRVGDLIAGTMVVEAPRRGLLRDLAAAVPSGKAKQAEYEFTREQLDLYGIYELQVLEELLRRPDADPKGLRAVSEKIRRKIGWDPEDKVHVRRFLQAFYKAQRARLEHKMLFGDRQEKKKEGKLDQQ